MISNVEVKIRMCILLNYLLVWEERPGIAGMWRLSSQVLQLRRQMSSRVVWDQHYTPFPEGGGRNNFLLF